MFKNSKYSRFIFLGRPKKEMRSHKMGRGSTRMHAHADDKLCYSLRPNHLFTYDLHMEVKKCV